MQQPTSPTPSHPLRLMLLDSPRTTCQVFYKLWYAHPQIGWGRFMHGFSGYQLQGPDRISPKLRHSDAVAEALQEYRVKPYQDDEYTKQACPPVLELAQKNFGDAVAGTEKEGKVFFGKEHILFLLKQDLILETLRRDDRGTVFPYLADNPTYIPDELIKTLTPIFLIRHPQLMANSQFRAQRSLIGMSPADEDFEYETTLKWTRILYDYFKDELGIEPVIIESEDFIFDTRAVTDKLCALYGLDPEGVRETWDPVPEAYWPQSEVARAFVGHMLASTGVERGEKRPTADLEAQASKWQEQYGAEVAAGLRKRVEAEMPVYEYLSARKLRP